MKTQIPEFVSFKQLPFGIAQVTFFTTNISNGFYVLYAHRPGSKTVPSNSLGQVDFLAEQVMFKTYLPNEQEFFLALQHLNVEETLKC